MAEKKEIYVTIKCVFGNDLVYPMNYKEELYCLTNTITLSPIHIKSLKTMGFDFTVMGQKLPEAKEDSVWEDKELIRLVNK